MPTNNEIAKSVLKAVGGKDNVVGVIHCVTRLRFTLKDEGIPVTEEVKKLPGVLGAQFSGGQFQVIIGQNVGKVYDEVCSLGGFTKQAAIDDDPDSVTAGSAKEPLTVKRVGNNILNYLSGAMVGIIPILMTCALMKTVGVVLGPSMLKVVGEDSDIFKLMNMVYNAGFYFLPIYLGYTAAKQIGATPTLGALMGGILIEPTFVQMVKDGGSISVFGLPTSMLNYAQTVLPVVLSVAALFFVERFFKRVLPEILAGPFAPFLTMFVMLPVSFCILAPLSSELGNLLGNTFFAIGSKGGVIGVAVTTLIGAFWEFLVMSGMHMVFITLAQANMLVTGSDTMVLVAAKCATWATFGMAFGCFLKMRAKDNKAMAFGCFISGILGGVTEPALFGVGMKYRRPFIGLVIGGAVGALISSVFHAQIFVGSMANFLGLLLYLPGGTANFIVGCVANVSALVIAAAVTFLFGFSSEELEEDAARAVTEQ